jgi:hypothetical protein
MSPEQIVKQQATSIENMKRDVNYIAALLRNQAGQAGDKVMMELLSKTTGKSLKELETAFSNWSQNQTGDIKALKEKFVEEVTKSIGTADDYLKKVAGTKKGDQTKQSQGGTPPKKDSNTKTTDNGPAATVIDLNKTKGPVYDGGTYVNPNSANNQKPVESKVPTTTPNSQIPSKKEEEKKEPEKPITVDVNLPNPLTAKIINENPINTTLSGESIKALESQKNLTTTEPNKPNNKFLGDFESRYGRINEPKDINPTQTGKVDNASLDRKLVIEKVESSNAQSTLASNNNELNKTEENKSVATVEHKHIVEMRVSSTGPIVDVLARAMLKDPTIVSQFIERDVREFV